MCVNLVVSFTWALNARKHFSLINADFNISSKWIARRLESVLLELVHPNQTGFIKGGMTIDSVRTTEDILEFT